MISLIVAHDTNRVIGKDGRLPWRLPADMVRFRNLTSGKVILLGRKTYDSLPSDLPGRTLVVLTHNPLWQPAPDRPAVALRPRCGVVQGGDIQVWADSLGDVLVAGGEEIYRLCYPLATRIYRTVVHAQYEGDAFFPEPDPEQWQITEQMHVPASALYPAYTFDTLHRKKT